MTQCTCWPGRIVRYCSRLVLVHGRDAVGQTAVRGGVVYVTVLMGCRLRGSDCSSVLRRSGWRWCWCKAWSKGGSSRIKAERGGVWIQSTACRRRERLLRLQQILVVLPTHREQQHPSPCLDSAALCWVRNIITSILCGTTILQFFSRASFPETWAAAIVIHQSWQLARCRQWQHTHAQPLHRDLHTVFCSLQRP